MTKLNSKLDYSEIEKKWQKFWKENGTNKTSNDFSSTKGKFYILDMFPYPSGEGLHVGHPKGYIATDVYSRMKKMQGYNVLHPMGWDAFGLPAEQFAIKNKINPNIATSKNVARYKEQIEMLGLNYDWDREINTTDPKYYKWTQWMWKQMYKDGLAYESFDPINWCPTCKTGLANEDLDGNTCERCGTIVEKKKLRQWTIRITDYADRLLADLDKLNWESHIKELQRNWIGKSEGSEIDFQIKVEGSINLESFKFRPELVSLIKEGKKNVTFRIGEKKNIIVGDVVSLIDWADGKQENQKEFTKARIIEISEFKLGELPLDYPGHEKDNSIEERLERYKKYYGDYVTNESIVYVYRFQPLFLKVFTTRADTLFGCTFMAISYNLAKEWIENGWDASDDIKKFIIKLEQEEKERTIDFDMSKLEKEGIDTGIKAINPANGEEVPIYIANYILSDYGTGAIMAVPAHDERDYEFAKKYNLEIRDVIERPIGEPIDKIYTGYGKVYNSASWVNGLLSEDAIPEIVGHVDGKEVSKYKLKDWVFARQRYWGEPFPIVFDENRKSYAVADKDLPVILPNVENYEPTDNGESPLSNIKDWVEVYGFINNEGEFESISGAHSERELKTINTYKENFETYISETVQEVSGEWKEESDFIVEKLKGKKVLEIGSASGRDASYLKNEGVDIIASDIVDSFSKINIDKGLEFIKIDPLLDDFHNEKYDGVLSMASLLHSERYNFEKIITKINLALNDNGYLYLRLKNGEGELEEERKGGYRFFSFYNENELKNILEKFGFEIEKITYLENNKWINVLAKKNKNLEIKKFFRETNTMPQWAGSSWYYLRYIDPKNDEKFVNKELEKEWSPVDFYVGGAEHATRHLIYARFWHKFLFDKGLVNYDEPFSKLQTVGLIMAEDGKKMSKRYGNVVNPDDVIKEYGCDAMRTYEMFMGPFEKSIAWNTNSMAGVSRFLERVYSLAEKINLNEEVEDSKETERIINETIKKVGEDIEKFGFNTAIAQLMICLNTFEEEIKKGNSISKNTFTKFIQILSPFAVHISEEIYQNILENKISVHLSEWPEVDVSKIKKEEIEMSIQISGKMRGTFIIKPDSSDEEVEESVKSTEVYQKYITSEAQIKKIIIVKNRLINIVI